MSEERQKLMIKQALMTIELQQLGTWDFGDVVWRNVMVQANTTDTKWCMQFVSLVSFSSPAQ
jgi:hypothetical protein